jgi:hypothetical protein
MGMLSSKDKTNGSQTDESSKEVRRKHIELLGREFRIVKDGLDPKEVMEFLEASAGSSEDAFKHLEQFSAFQAVARTMEESISQAKQLAEQAKAKAKAEVDRERAKATAEIQQQSSAILDETTRSCTASVEGIHNVILDAITRTEEIQQEAFKKTREMIAVNMAEIQQNIQAIVDGQYDKAEPDVESTAYTPDMPTEPDTIVFNEVEDEETEDEPVFDLANLQESLMSLELSLSNLNESKHSLEPTLETQVNVLERDEEEDIEEDEEGHPTDTESPPENHDDSSEDTSRQYSGEVTVQIVGGAEESWMQELRKRMFDLPGARIRAESGVDEKTTMVSLSLDEPVKLFPILMSLPRVSRVIPGQLNSEKEGMKLRLWPRSQKNSTQNTVTVELHNNGNTNSAMAESEDEPIAAS